MRISTFRLFAVLASLTMAAATPLQAPSSEPNHVSAIAVRNDESHLQKRATTAYFVMCEHMNFGGICKVAISPWSLCTTLLEDSDDWASSAFVSAGSTCTLYWDRLCLGQSTTITADGVLNLNTIGWDNKATSYRCQSV